MSVENWVVLSFSWELTIINCKYKHDKGPPLQQSFILWQFWKMKLHRVCILITLLNCYWYTLNVKHFILLLAHTWLIRSSAWQWGKEVPEFSILSSCMQYLKIMPYLSLFFFFSTWNGRWYFPVLCKGFGQAIPVSVEGMLALPCRALGCWLGPDSELEELSHLRCSSAGISDAAAALSGTQASFATCETEILTIYL